MKFKKLPIKIISIVVFLIILCGIGYYFFQQKSSQVKTIDNFPIWLLRDGKVAVYQEVTIDSNKYERKVVVNNLSGEDQKEVKIYVEIPKEIAQKASDLKFSSDVEVVKDDPIVLWSVGKPGQTSTEMSWTDTALVLPRAIGLTLTWTRNIAMNNLTDVCKTKTAKDWIEKNTWEKDKASFLACGEYLEHIEKVVQERTASDWQNKMDENKVTQTIDSSNPEYKQIQQKAKQKIAEQAKPTTIPKANNDSKITAEEAIDIIRKDVQKNPRFDNIAKFNLECKATYSQEDQGWRVICGRRNFERNKYMMNFHYEFYLVKDKKSWKQAGYYESVTDYNGYTFPTIGKPMWGVK